jgi:hypothetical protein
LQYLAGNLRREFDLIKCFRRADEAAENSDSWAKLEEDVPQRLKPAIFLLRLRHPSAALRTGFEAVPFQNNEFFRSL